MQYRYEIDGLRALAVLPVMFFHAGFELFSGGFVGVDVFFVISGYLITTIILTEIEQGKFSLVNFYERRARRILPALFLVMLASLGFSFFWMLPDELENFGQSLVATSLFSNNILLFMTSGYWDLASEFKPLLHTWSLSIEEQYYVVFPLILIIGHRLFRGRLVYLVFALLLLSLIAALLGVTKFPEASFYLLYARAWELLVGSVVAFYLLKNDSGKFSARFTSSLSVVGLAAILFAVFFFDSKTPTPGSYTLVPVLGTALVLVFAQKPGFVRSILSSSLLVKGGLISYSAYLWHVPLFVFARVYFPTPPSKIFSGFLILVSLFLACVTWRFVEKPFRDRSKISRNVIFIGSLLISLFFVVIGVFLHKTRGLPGRMYPVELASGADMNKHYNQNFFKYKTDHFPDNGKLNLLVVGNSFGRDFVNMTIENFDLSGVNLVYRDDLKECISSVLDEQHKTLFSDANIIVFASGEADQSCIDKDISLADHLGKNIFYAGPKHFGYNSNWLMRVPIKDRVYRYNPLLKETIEAEKRFLDLVPQRNRIDILGPITIGSRVLITDEQGRLLSPDRAHLTRYGAMFVGKKVLTNTLFAESLGKF